MTAVSLLTSSQEADWEEIFQSSPCHLVYYSLKYRSLLRSLLSDTEDKYLIAYQDGFPAGALPVFVKQNDQIGPVVNSLPFFGSNGGIMMHVEAREKTSVKKELLAAFYDLAGEVGAAASTIISNPLLPDETFYKKNARYTFIDKRIGQIVDLRKIESGSSENISEQLMASYHRKTRNHIRKSLRSNITVSVDNGADAFEKLRIIHYENMQALGGKKKPGIFFSAIQNKLEPEKDFLLYTADFGNETIAMLLLIFSNKTCEYFMPVTQENHRSLQPMSLLIKCGMEESVRRGMHYWNWGGTWLSQDGVYQFKSRWGTDEIPYRYYVDIRDKEILSESPDRLSREFPYFYVCPFEKLNA